LKHIGGFVDGEMCGGNWVVITMDCNWTIAMGRVGLLGAEQLRRSVVKLVVTLLQLSHRAACSNTQHCLKLPTFSCTSVSTALLDLSDLQVIIIAVTDGYTGFLSVPVSISLPYPFAVRSG
jgi:hypothetical protein